MADARFSLIPAQAVCDPRLNSRALQVLALLGTYTDKNGWCYPSQAKLSNQLGCSRPTINRAIKLIVECGYMEKVNRFEDDGGQLTNGYKFSADRWQS